MGGIFENSNIGKALESGKMNVPHDKPHPGTDELMPYVVVRDEPFPLKTYLLRSCPGSQIKGDETKTYLNYQLSCTCRMVENAFGILAQPF